MITLAPSDFVLVIMLSFCMGVLMCTIFWKEH